MSLSPEGSYSYYVLGLLFILLVALIQALSSALVQYLYVAKAFESPFLLTYIGVSLFTWPLPVRFVTDKVIHACFEASVSACDVCKEVTDFVAPEDCANCQTPYFSHDSRGNISETIPTATKSFSGSFDKMVDPSNDSSSDDDDITVGSRSSTRRGKEVWTSAEHLRAALQIAPVWFIANWSYNASLSFSSISASTVLMSSCSLFAFLFAVLSHSEGFHWMKLGGVGMGILGSGLTAFHDSQMNTCHRDCRYALLGDFLAFLAAIAFGVYAVQIKTLCPRDEELYSMQRILGYIGLVNMLVLSPVAIWKLMNKVEMSFVVFQLIIVRGLADYVLSEYLYFKAVVYTNATVATLGLGLTIPFAFAADIFMGYPEVFSLWSGVGALCMVFGFLLVNAGSVDEDYNKSGLIAAKEYELQKQEELKFCHQLPCGCIIWMDDEETLLGEESDIPRPTGYVV